jgi:hypothetical protein
MVDVQRQNFLMTFHIKRKYLSKGCFNDSKNTELTLDVHTLPNFEIIFGNCEKKLIRQIFDYSIFSLMVTNS